MAEFIFKQMIEQEGLSDEFEVDSAATDGVNEKFHLGMDHRAMQELRERDIPFHDRPSRQIRAEDYAHFDYILVMDSQNLYSSSRIFGADEEHKIHRLLDFTDHPRDIKDPWYTGDFGECYWDLYDGCRAFLDYLEV